MVDGLRQQIEASRAALVDGAGDLPDNVAPLWRECLKALDGAIKAVEPVRGKVGRLWARGELTMAARQQQSEQLVRGLLADVQARLDTAERLLGEIAFALQEGVTPARPEGLSEARELDRKHDLEALLKCETGWKGVLDRVTQLMGEAIVQHDDLTAWTLTPDGPLAWVYKLLGVDRAQLRAALYRAIRRAHRLPVPGEGLLQRYEAPHTDPLSWQTLRSTVLELVGAVGALAAAQYRAAGRYTPPADAGNPQRVPGESAVPPGLRPSLDLNAVH